MTYQTAHLLKPKELLIVHCRSLIDAIALFYTPLLIYSKGRDMPPIAQCLRGSAAELQGLPHPLREQPQVAVLAKATRKIRHRWRL
jgi:hypothetical protein